MGGESGEIGRSRNIEAYLGFSEVDIKLINTLATFHFLEFRFTFQFAIKLARQAADGDYEHARVLLNVAAANSMRARTNERSSVKSIIAKSRSI